MIKISFPAFLFLVICNLTVKPTFAQKTGQGKMDSLIMVLKSEKDDTIKVKTLNSISYEAKGNNPDTAIYFANEALVLATKLKYKPGIANANSFIGLAKKNLGEYEEALKYQLIALKIFEEIDTKHGIAKTYQNIGNIYSFLGNYPEALKNHFNALSIYEKLGEKKGIVDSYNNIGVFYKNQDNYPEALKYHFAALKISKEIKYRNGLTGAYGGIGIVYIFLNNYTEALKYLLETLEMDKQEGNKKEIAGCYNNIGKNYYSQNNYPEALKNYFASLKIKEEIKAKDGIATTYTNIGDIYTKQKKYNLATEYLGKGLTLAKETRNLEEIKYAYYYLQELDVLQGNYRKAYEHNNLYIDYRDSLVNEENTKKTVRTQMQYEFNKKEATTKAAQDKKEVIAKAEIEKQKVIRNSIAGGTGILTLSSVFSFLFYKRRRDAVEKQKEAEFGLQVSEVEMTALRSQMNPHFIFNSLHSINNYMMNNDKRNASDYLGKFSKLMRLILENSREQDVPLEKDLSSLELYLELEAMRFENKFSYRIEVADDIDPENTLVPPMILQPFVENAILHGLQHKEGDGKIIIRIQRENNMISCMVEDNGVGRQKAMEMKEKTSTHQGESLGMKITNARIDIINKIKKAKASVSLEDLAEGMRVEVKLPYELAF